jgi:hypothetical protein
MGMVYFELSMSLDDEWRISASGRGATTPPSTRPCSSSPHDAHDPIVKDGGTTYSVVTDGLESALGQARAAAGDKDITIGGGANIVRQCLAAGVIKRSP